MSKDNEQKRFAGTMAAIDDAILAATPAEIAEELRALGIEPGAAATAMRARIGAAVHDRGKKLMAAALEQTRRDRGLKVIFGSAQPAGDLRAKLARLLSRPGVLEIRVRSPPSAARMGGSTKMAIPMLADTQRHLRIVIFRGAVSLSNPWLEPIS